jgi:flagellar hook-associated protein 3 FlgL
VKELAVQAGGGVLSATDRKAIAAEISTRLDEILGLANTRDAAGDYVFAGYRVDTEPFTRTVAGGTVSFAYQGDASARRIQVGPNLQVPSADSGQSVFVEVPTAAGGERDLLSTLQSLVDTLEGAAAGTIDEATYRSQLASTQDDLGLALEHILTVRARVGARLNEVEAQRDIAAAFELYSTESLSTVEDLDYAEASGRLQLQLTVLQASQQAFVRVQGLSLFDYL